MKDATLKRWLLEPRTALVSTIAECVLCHVDAQKASGVEFYGYALHPGEIYDITSLVAVTNGIADIEAAPTARDYGYYKFCVDEWSFWERGAFEPANALLVEENEQFKALHSKNENDSFMDEYEVAHASVLLDAVLKGLELAKSRAAFDGLDPFIVVWMSDCSHPLVGESVRRLNSATVAAQFLEEFG